MRTLITLTIMLSCFVGSGQQFEKITDSLFSAYPNFNRDQCDSVLHILYPKAVEYSYSWSYWDGKGSDGWGQDEITLSFKPSKEYLRKIAWKNYQKMSRGDGRKYPIEYKYFDISTFYKTDKYSDKKELKSHSLFAPIAPTVVATRNTMPIKIGSLEVDREMAEAYLKDCYVHPDTIEARGFYQGNSLDDSLWYMHYAMTQDQSDYNSDLKLNAITVLPQRKYHKDEYIVPRKPSEQDFVKWNYKRNKK